MPSEADGPRGPLEGLRVLELASEHAAFAGKVLGDLGADVLLVEPPGGHPTRHLAPFVDDLDDGSGDRSLWFWHYNTSKSSVQLDLTTAAGAEAFRGLVAHADIVLEAEPVGRLHELGLDEVDLRPAHPSVVWVSVTPYGRHDPRSREPVTDLTLLAGGGIVWMNGYDDHSLPPVGALGNQAFQTASMWAVLGGLVACQARRGAAAGAGQLVDVSMHAAVNLTTEAGSHVWLVARKVVQRQQGRHASQLPTDPVVRQDRDGNEVHTGFAPHQRRDLQHLLAWIEDEGLTDELPMVGLIEMAVEAGGIDLAHLRDDPLVQEQYRAGREAMAAIAARLSGHEFFVQAQEHGFAAGVIYAPEEMMQDPHLVARGFPTPVFQPQLGREVLHPGVPLRFTGSPAGIRRAPSLGEVADAAAGWPS